MAVITESYPNVSCCFFQLGPHHIFFNPHYFGIQSQARLNGLVGAHLAHRPPVDNRRFSVKQLTW